MNNIIEVPKDVIQAAVTVQDWFTVNHMKYWELYGVCSRNYAYAIHDFVPKLRKLREHPGGQSVVQQHNEAFKKLKAVGRNEL